MQYEKAPARIVVWRESRRAVAAGVGGLVCSPREVNQVKRFKKTKGLYTLVPGTRSLGANTNDQKRPTTPKEAILAGADLLVIGRQVTGAEEPVSAFSKVEQEIEQALNQRFGLTEAA